VPTSSLPRPPPFPPRARLVYGACGGRAGSRLVATSRWRRRMRPWLEAIRREDDKDGAYDFTVLRYERGPHRFLARRRCEGMSFWDMRRDLSQLLEDAGPERVGESDGNAGRGDAPGAGELDGPGLWIDPALVYPRFDARIFTRAPTEDGFFVKRPCLFDYEEPSRRATIAPLVEAEAHLFEQLRELPQCPTIVRYHGVSVVGDRIEGLVLDRLGINLYGRVKAADAPPLDVAKVVKDVGNALTFLHHRLGYCHNDVSPQNIVVKGAGDDTAVLLDFDAAKPIDEPLDKGNLPDWGNGATTSRVENDWQSLAKVERWLRTGIVP